jgi:beta-glucosidase
MKALFLRIIMTLTCAVMLLALSCNESTEPKYKNPGIAIGERVKDLLSRMTLEEKVAQITCVLAYKGNSHFTLFDSLGTLNVAMADTLFNNGLGHIRVDQSLNLKPEYSAIAANNLQRYLKEKTRLGIPVILHEEGLHGHVNLYGTSFSMPIGLASTWDPELAEKLFAMTAEEIRSRGSHYVLAPVVDLGREQRWGRTEETFGEDPYLVSRIGLAAVYGFQGRDSVMDNTKHIIATLKHFLHGEPEGGRNTAPCFLSERTLRETYLYPFQVCVTQGRVESIMASYNELSGIPCVTNTWLLQDVLRGEWGFKGAVVSDYWAIPRLYELHHTARDAAEAARQAVTAGVDIELVEASTYPKLKEEVENKRIDMAIIDRAVSRILRHKFVLGLFENPYVDPEKAEKLVGCEANRKLSLEGAYETMTLLKNDRNIVPLDINKIKTLAVIGPNADRVLLGGYSYTPRQFVTVLTGLKAKVGNKINVLHSEGCRINERRNGRNIILSSEENKGRIRDAVSVARESDAVILAVGANEELSGEGVDRANLGLVGSQNDLVRAVAETGKPVIALLFNGSPLAMDLIKEKANVVFECWYMGQECGTAVADILFGDQAPSGKLPITIPRSVGQLPVYYDRKPTSFGGYVFEDASPLYPFGYGMSYTSFKYSNLRLDRDEIRPDEGVKVHVDITNTGKRKGTEVVQLYIRDEVSSVTRPVMELRDFQRVALEPGETKTVDLDITPEKLSLYDLHMNHVVEPGGFDIMIGASSVDIRLHGKLTVTEAI